MLLELDNRPIGNMIMSQLQIHLASEGVVDDVVSLVAALIAELNAEQQEADRIHNQDQVTCESQISGTQAKYEHHDDEADTCDQTQSDTEGLLGEAEQAHEFTLVQIEDLGRLIEEGTNLRASQAEAYAFSMEHHQVAIDALTEAIKIIGAFHSGGSWIQLQSKVEKVT